MVLLTPLAIAFCIPTESRAAQTFKVPIVVVPGSVSIGSQTGRSLPLSHPFGFHFETSEGVCDVTGTIATQLVNQGLELQIDVNAAGTGGPCLLPEVETLTLRLTAPEFPGTATMVRLHAEVQTLTLPSNVVFRIGMSQREPATTSSEPGVFDLGSWSTVVSRNAPGSPVEPTGNRLTPLIPGDVVEIPVSLDLSAQDSASYSGTIRVRFEVRVTVPEPTASLSLPLGALTLLGLASLRA
ncbi:MAG: hypothetical protein U0900_22780 [Myxococcota bacterium]